MCWDRWVPGNRKLAVEDSPDTADIPCKSEQHTFTKIIVGPSRARNAAKNKSTSDPPTASGAESEYGGGHEQR
jgi:hypothetical protein